MLTTQDTVCVLVDLQDKLAAVMHDRQRVSRETCKLISGLGVLGVPVVHTEQNPRALGTTVAPVRELLTEPAIEKLAFSCCGQESFPARLRELGRPNVLLAGIEAHVCVYQTAVDLLGDGYRVQVVTDCVSSRTPQNLAIGLERMRAEGVVVASVEMCLFELLRVARGDAFKQILKIVK